MKPYRLPKDSNNNPVQVVKPGRTLAFTFGTTATYATGNSRSNVVRCLSTVDAHLLFVGCATQTLAATNDLPLAAGVPEYIGIDDNTLCSARIAATATATAGSIWITEPS